MYLICKESLQFGIGLSTLIGSVFRLITKAAFPLEQVRSSSPISSTFFLNFIFVVG